MIHKIFRMLNQSALDIPTLPVYQCLSHLIQIHGGMVKCSEGMPSRREGPPSIWDMVYRETFLKIQMRHHQHLILKNLILLGRKLLRNQFTCLQRRKVEDQNETQIRDASLDRKPKFQSSSVEETLQRIMGQTNNDCRFQIFICTNSPHQQRMLVGENSRLKYVLVHNSLWKLCNGSKKWIWLIHWMIEDLRLQYEVFRMPDFEIFDAKIASVLNIIIHDSQFKRRNSLEE